MSFHIVVPSNSSMEVFPRNTLSNFKVRFAKPIELHNPYVVALEELIYPNANFSFPTGETYIQVKQVQKNYESEVIDYKLKLVETIEMNFGSEDGIEIITNEINSKLKKYDWVLATGTSNRFIFQNLNVEASYSLMLHPKLAYLLGFVDDLDFYVVVGAIKHAHRPSPLIRNQQQMYVYGDFVQSQLVGDTMAPLIRICLTNKDTSNAYCSEKYIRPYYLPVAKDRIEQVHIEVRTHDGLYYPFPTGAPLICKFHFKPA